MNICRDEGRKWVSNKDGSRVGRGAKIEEKNMLVGSCGWVGGGWATPLHPEPDLWVAEMTDGGTTPTEGHIRKKSPAIFAHHCHKGEDK